MKKLVFAAIAAMVMVSVNNVFASNKMASVSSVAPVDTVAPAEPAAPADTTVEKETTSPLFILPMLPQVPTLTTTSAPVLAISPEALAAAKIGPTPETKVRKSPPSPLISALSEATTSIFFIICKDLQ